MKTRAFPWYKEEDWRTYDALEKGYDTFYVDIDGKELTRVKAVHLLDKLGVGYTADVFKTRKGYHVKAYLRKAVPGLRLLPVVLEFGCDPLYVRRWLSRQGFAIFRVRRGVENEKHLYTLRSKK